MATCFAVFVCARQRSTCIYGVCDDRVCVWLLQLFYQLLRSRDLDMVVVIPLQVVSRICDVITIFVMELGLWVMFSFGTVFPLFFLLRSV